MERLICLEARCGRLHPIVEHASLTLLQLHEVVHDWSVVCVGTVGTACAAILQQSGIATGLAVTSPDEFYLWLGPTILDNLCTPMYGPMQSCLPTPRVLRLHSALNLQLLVLVLRRRRDCRGDHGAVFEAVGH